MTSQSPVPLTLAFVKADTPMFAELIDQLHSDSSLSDGRRRDMISGLRRVAKALGLPPEDVPCDSRWLQPRLTKVAPASLGLTLKSWQNAVSDARAALAHFGLVERRFNRIYDLSPDWHALWADVLASGDKTLQPALCRFVHYLNRQGVNLSELYRSKVADLAKALSDPSIRTGALEIIRGLIERVSVQHKQDSVQIELEGALSAMIGLTQNEQSRPEAACSRLCSTQVVAGAGFEPATFRL
ncbi:hypothetical protein [Ruegeria lacuscaerulensis]|uniref:hypothetical protein n=1 Tax=Ruegeria lacuscaerulensis TaxID=55218 RepID=UPI00147C22A3|nr:hypothetical protein [Ruegeria lacuscaerulensis]